MLKQPSHSATFLSVAAQLGSMSEKSTRRYEETRNKGDADLSQAPPPPEPIYDLTTDDKTELVKGATPRERNEEP